jgi:hypothetical protein
MHLAAVLLVPTQDAVGDPAMQIQFSKQSSSLLLLRYRLSSLLFCHSIPKLSNWTIHNLFPLYKLLLPALHCIPPKHYRSCLLGGHCTKTRSFWIDCMIAIWGSVNIGVSFSYEESESFTSSSEFVDELETCSRSLGELELCSGRTVCLTWNYPSHFKIGISWYTVTVDLHMHNLNAFLESQFNDLSAAESLQ